MSIAPPPMSAPTACGQATLVSSSCTVGPAAGTNELDARAFPYTRLPRWTNERLRVLDDHGQLVAVQLSPRDEFQHYDSKNKRFHLSSWAWRLVSGGMPRCDVRVVYISGTKNTIINTWAFPYAPGLQPVFAAELIALGDTPKLTFMDIQGPCLSPMSASLSLLKSYL